MTIYVASLHAEGSDGGMLIVISTPAEWGGSFRYQDAIEEIDVSDLIPHTEGADVHAIPRDELEKRLARHGWIVTGEWENGDVEVKRRQ